MADPVVLLFQQAATAGAVADLLFGDIEGEGGPVAANLTGTLPPLTVAAAVATVTDAGLTGAFAPLAFVAQATYLSNTDRPIVGRTCAAWQIAAPTNAGVNQMLHQAVPTPTAVVSPWQRAVGFREALVAHLSDAQHLQRAVGTGFQNADRVPAAISERSMDALRDRRLMRAGLFQNARRANSASLQNRFQNALRDRRNWTAGFWQDALGEFVAYTGSMSQGHKRIAAFDNDFQDAMRPPPGIHPDTGQPSPDPCYLPPAGDEAHLLFGAVAGGPSLVFFCERHPVDPPDGETVVVPVRRVYVVLNDASLKRVEGNVALPTFNMSMTLDFQSWTWGFSATLPPQALAHLEPSTAGVPVEVEASINGVAYRFQVERRARSRTFGRDSITIAGRGKAALLDSPYAPIMAFENSEARTSQQLMADVLTLNGVPLDWTVDWGVTAWTVPAGVFAHQGSYMGALNAIAASAGAYIQPHATGATLRVLPLYPFAPWEWGDVVPDYELPAAVTTQEAVEWSDKPVYNRVYVSGTKDGVLGRVTRAGTAGDLVAPTIVDPLTTAAVAARQRGLPVLADTGPRADVTLRLPVLSATGIIVPGKFVDYVDGATTRRGLVRGVQVDVARPEVWQTIRVETR